MAERLASVNAKAKTASTAAASSSRGAATANTNEVLARVEILDANKNIIHQDESPLVVNVGTAYREYVLADDASEKPYKPAKPATEARTGSDGVTKKFTETKAKKIVDPKSKARPSTQK